MNYIESEEQYQIAMSRIEDLLAKITEDTPEDDENYVELVRLSNMVADYDDVHYPMNCHC